MDLIDKVIVITGASHGLGKELAIHLAEDGAKLALLARSKDELLHVRREVVDMGAQCESFVCDVTKLDQIQKTVNEIIKKFGSIDILVNNAGIWRGPKFQEEAPEEIEQIFAVNTLGPIFFTRTVLPHMLKNNKGQILNIVSISGIETPGKGGTYSIYTSSKYALRGFTDSLEKELNDTKIKVMGFYPGGMDTNIIKAAGYKYKVDKNTVMNTKDVVKILSFMLKQPDDVIIDHLVVRKLGQLP